MERPRVREGGRQAAGRRALIAESAGSGTPYPSEGRSAGSDVRASGDPRLHALEGESVYPRSCREESIAEAVADVAADALSREASVTRVVSQREIGECLRGLSKPPAGSGWRARSIRRGRRKGIP